MSKLRRQRVPPALRVVLGLLLLDIVGTLLLMLPGVTKTPSSFVELWFTATSAVTVTGLTIETTSTTFTRFGQIIILLLIQMGGLGYMVMAVLALRFFGQRISFFDRLALTHSLGLDRPGAVMQIMRRSVYIMLIIEATGALLLYLHWRTSGIVPQSEVLFFAIFHAVSAFCNAGFDLFTGLSRYPLGLPNDALSLIIMGLLVVLGGLGLPVLLELFLRRQSRRLTLHTRLTLAAMAGLTLFGWLGLFIGEHQVGGVLHDVPIGERIVTTWFQSVSTRTAGFPGLDNFNDLLPASQLLVMGLMFIGSAPASMGGGITTGTFVVLTVAFISYVRGYKRARMARRTISIGTVRRSAALLSLSLIVVMVATWLLLITNEVSLGPALFEIVSAFATCGLSLGITGDLNGFGLLLIMFMMFWGRLGALTLVVALLQRQSGEQLLEYPEEPVLIG